MKGFISKAIAALGLVGGLTGVGGCDHYRDVVDPCYPERYWHQSRQNVHAAIAPQVKNGHVLDQTVWNYHFETVKDDKGNDQERLTVAGQERLKYLARRRPAPDPMVFVQTAQDAVYDPAKSPEVNAKVRGDLDARRVAAVENYLATISGGVAPFQVFVHNPPEVGMAGVHADPALRQMYTTPRATLPGQVGTSSSGGGGGGGR
jgi:hypothetical protein